VGWVFLKKHRIFSTLVHRFLAYLQSVSAVNPHDISHYSVHCCIALQRTDWLMIVAEINKVALQCKN